MSTFEKRLAALAGISEHEYILRKKRKLNEINAGGTVLSGKPWLYDHERCGYCNMLYRGGETVCDHCGGPRREPE